MQINTHFKNKKFGGGGILQIFIKSFPDLIINQHVRMISDESCDNEDWNNDVQNSALHHRNTLYFKVYYNRKPLF